MFAGLVTAVGAAYKQKRPGDSEISQFKVGDKWIAYVQPTGDFIVRNEARCTICRGNLHTGEETLPLLEDYVGELERMLVEREGISHQHRQPTHYSFEQQFIL